MTYDELESRYYELKGKHAAGLLSDDAFRARVDELRIEDAQGRTWAIGAESGHWYVYDGEVWVAAEPTRSAATGWRSCPQCGALLEEGAGFCGSCGAALTPPPPAVPSMPSSPASSDRGPGRGVVIGLIAAVGVVLLACLGLVVYGVIAPGRPLMRVLSDRVTETPTRQPVCTPPACGPNEAYHCPDECPGGCGVVCATFTPRAASDEGDVTPSATLKASSPVEATGAPKVTSTEEAASTLEPTSTSEATATPALSSTPEASSTPGASSTPRPPGLITGFETFGTWVRGDEAHGTFAQQSDRVHGGSYAAALDYNLPTSGKDFVIFMRDIPLDGEPNVIRAWVYEDGSGSFLNVWIRDAEGERWQATFGQLTGTGWRQREAVIQAGQPWPWGHIDGPSDGEVDYPIAFNGLLLAGVAGSPRTGSIAIDDLTYATLVTLPSTLTPTGSTARTPTPCARQPRGWFEGALMFASGAREKVGCPTGDAQTVTAVSQDFERGIMIWRADEGLIYVLYDGGSWESYQDRWEAGMPEQDPAYGPAPAGLFQPKRGFGLVWQDYRSVREGLGWALMEERSCDSARVQPFERGLMLSCEQDVVPRAKIRVFIVFDDYTYTIFMPG